MATTCGIAVQTKIFFSELLQKQKKSQLYLITYFVSPQYLPFLINVEKLLLMHLYIKFNCCINSFNNGTEHLQYDYFENGTNFFQAISSKKLAALQFYSTHLNKSSLQKIIYYWPEGSVLQDLKNRTEHLAGQKGICETITFTCSRTIEFSFLLFKRTIYICRHYVVRFGGTPL